MSPAYASPVKRSITIAGHRTSLSLEPAFWELLLEHAEKRGRSLGAIVSEIDDARGRVNLSCAVRTFILSHVTRRLALIPDLLAAGQAALRAADEHIRSEYEGTSYYQPMLATLEPSRVVIANATTLQTMETQP